MRGKGNRSELASESKNPEPSETEPSLDRAVQSRIGDHLRAMYDELLQQPVPDRFQELLAKLDDKSEPSA
jgi:hypothetical protein